jgi:hypothetical protein
MVICAICKKQFDNVNGLAKHITNQHKETSKKSYYDAFISDVKPICYCGREKRFRGLGVGYGKYCSQECRNNSETFKAALSNANKGKKQSKETVEKRIRNTDQLKREEKRKSTMIEKYGVDNPTKINEVKEKLSKKFTGRKTPRKPGQQEKILAAKRKNGTMRHTKETIEKIRKSVNARYQSDDPPITLSENNHKNHKTGYFNGQFYRSSYERKFMEYCYGNGIKYESAETKDFRLSYTDGVKTKWYYPDFYLEKYDVVVEIKPSGLLTDDTVLSKMNVGMRNYRFVVIDEEILSNLDELFEELENEYLYLIG